MATILFVWELGGGLGHMLPMRPLAEGLVAAGHRVFVAVRNPAGATQVFAKSRVHFLAAPCKFGGRAYVRTTRSMAHVLANVGWARGRELFGLACAWRTLFLLVRPDLVVFDHSPTAMLASRCLPHVKRAQLGNGFFCPPEGDPLPLFPNFRPADDGSRREREGRLRADETILLRHANRVLKQWNVPPMRRLGQVFADVDETFLATFPELDQYGAREGVRYWGPDRNHAGGKPVVWPEAPAGGSAGASGKRIYAYLKDSPLVPDLLEALVRRGHRTVVYCDGVNDDVRRRFQGPTVRFEDERLDLAQAGRECDLAIHNANAGTAAEMLLAGRPALQLPLVLEQVLTARAVERLAAGETVTSSEGKADPAAVARKLDAVLSDPTYAEAARRFAGKYAAFDWEARRREMVGRLEQLLPGRAPARPAAATTGAVVTVGAVPAAGIGEVVSPQRRAPDAVAHTAVGGIFRG